MEKDKRYCVALNDAIVLLVEQFARKYYSDFSVSYIDSEDDGIHYNLLINDDYWNIDEIFTALWYDIPKEILFKYLDERMDHALKGDKMQGNLKNFYILTKK